MAKLYTKNTWQDEILSGDERYNVLDNAGTPINSNVQINLNTAVVQAGTAVDAARMNNLENGLDAVDTRADFHGATAETTPVDADEMPITDSGASFAYKKLTWASIKAALKAYFDAFYFPVDGWVSAGETWTYAGADSPSFTFTIAGDKTGKYQAGQKVKLTQTTVKYFVITAVSYSSPNTTITVYGGTDYTLANAAITSPYFSSGRAPFGFPLDPAKWTVKVSNTTNNGQTSPTATTWYNLGGFSITIPIGMWNVFARVNASCDGGAVASATIKTTLSTANNSESDGDFTYYASQAGASATASQIVNTPARMSKTITLAAKTTYYLNTRTDNSGAANIYNQNGNVTNGAFIMATCAYL